MKPIMLKPKVFKPKNPRFWDSGGDTNDARTMIRRGSVQSFN